MRVRLADEPERGGSVADQTKGSSGPTESPIVTISMDQLKDLLASVTAAMPRGGDLSAEALAKAFQAQSKRENAQAPMVSHANPRGETDRPRPAFTARKVLHNGVELETDTMCWEEIEAINALTPGEYRVTKANGQRIPFTVRVVRGADETTVERLEFSFPCKHEHRMDHRSLFDYCLEAIRAASGDTVADGLVALQRTLAREREAVEARRRAS
jgi:hypothetical protein